MKVGVYAGTPVDTQMGVDLLEEIGIETLAFPLAQDPMEQTRLQYFSKEELESLMEKKIQEGRSLGMEKVFIYCNSLSSAIDYEKISKKMGIKIITPLESYKNLPADVKNIAIFAANGISAYKVDEIITRTRPEIRTIPIGNLALVESIEEKKSPEEIIKNLNIRDLISYLENIRDQRYKIDSIILACTHFPYLKEELKKLTKLRIIDPVENMIRSLG